MDGFERLQEILKNEERVAVAYSGGVDSSFLMAACVDALGAENVLGIYVETALHPKRERFDAYVLAQMRGWTVKVLEVDIADKEEILRNDERRCYFCKRAIFAQLRAYAEKKGISVILDGTNTDDLGEYRPGVEALSELDIRSPFREAGLSKADIRKLSKSVYDLPTWNKPSQACLATRIPYGTPIREEDLEKVEKGEAYLHELGYLTCRLRLHGVVGRVEIPEEDFEKFLTRHSRDVAAYFRDLGILYTALDVLGFRSGSGTAVLERR